MWPAEAEATIELVRGQMVGQHQENALTVFEERERRYQERMKAYLKRNPSKRLGGWNLWFTLGYFISCNKCSLGYKQVPNWEIKGGFGLT